MSEASLAIFTLLAVIYKYLAVNLSVSNHSLMTTSESIASLFLPFLLFSNYQFTLDGCRILNVILLTNTISLACYTGLKNFTLHITSYLKYYTQNHVVFPPLFSDLALFFVSALASTLQYVCVCMCSYVMSNENINLNKNILSIWCATGPPTKPIYPMTCC